MKEYLSTEAEMKAQLKKAGVDIPEEASLQDVKVLFDDQFTEVEEVSQMGDRNTIEVVEEKPTRVHEYKQDHIFIKVNVTMMNGKKASRKLKIKNPVGCMARSQVNNAEGVFQTLFSGMVSKYGAGHIE